MFTLNQRVEANSSARGRWYPGVIIDSQLDGRYTVRYDPPGPPNFPDGELNIPAEYIRPMSYHMGDIVEVNSNGQGTWYQAQITGADAGGTYSVRYTGNERPQGERRDAEHSIPPGFIRARQNQAAVAARRMEPVRDNASIRRQMEEDARLAERLQVEDIVIQDEDFEEIHDVENVDSFNMEFFS